MPEGTRAMSYHTLAVTYSTLHKTKASACQTKPPVTVFVLPNKYAHIHDIVTQKAYRVMTHVPVSSPFYPKSCGGSQIVTQHLQSCGNFVKKANHVSRCDKGTLRNIENVVGNFVTCTDGCYGGFKNVTIMFQHGNEAGH